MAEMPSDATAPESCAALRTLPRGVQVGVGLVLIGAVVFGIVFFDRQNGGGGLTDPGKTVPHVGDRLAALPLTTARRPALRYGDAERPPGVDQLLGVVVRPVQGGDAGPARRSIASARGAPRSDLAAYQHRRYPARWREVL